MRFTYVRVRWEGSAHDSRILRNTLLDPNYEFPMPPPGKYYVVDATYTNMPGFMALFRGARETPQERSAKALFNRRHASLKNIIERTFCVLKKHFLILEGPMQNYMMATQNNIVLACCALHNFMWEHVPNDAYFNEQQAVGAWADNLHDGQQVLGQQPVDMSAQGIANWNEDRRAIANHMYYHHYH
ncbi:putative nuclease HARBI1 [Coffea eugenioides]|uniref:putative nuclease HARBI1 n=1 Tax=Coffea eugenioides TaxID=49369 RepID=UPI000F60FA0F|nr:putative nuclease HARBI1 [Coffea eugenioides]